jgi:hypothetical protein
MGYKDDLVKKKDGTYVLKHKTREAKEGDCIECGENKKNRMSGGIYRYRTEDMLLVREYMEDHLRMHSGHKSIKPIWCKKCKSLLEYRVVLDTKKSYR